MQLIKRYWIAGLVVTLVVIHAIIIGYVRSEATRIKIAASNEIPVGLYYVQSQDKLWMSQLRVHVLVPPEKRLSAKATIEHQRWLIHEAIEETLRQLSPSLLEDAVLLEIKEQIKLAIEETLQQKIIDRVVVNDRVDIPIRQFEYPVPRNITEPETIYASTSQDSAADVPVTTIDNATTAVTKPQSPPAEEETDAVQE